MWRGSTASRERSRSARRCRAADRAAGLHRPARARRRRRRHDGRRRRRRPHRAHARAARHHGAAGHDDDRAAGRHRSRAARAGAVVPAARAPAPRACWACTSKARTSTPASSARSPTFARAPTLAEILRAARAGADPRDHPRARDRRQHGADPARWCAAGVARADRPQRRQLRRRRGRAASAAPAGFTHLFNAMTGLHHRAPGMVGAALAHARIRRDHSRPAARAPRRDPRRAARDPELYCVTDSTAAAGMPDGEYQLGRHTVTKCLGGVRLADGTLAGSTLTMDQALRNLVGLGLDAGRRVAPRVAPRGRLPRRSANAAGSRRAPGPTWCVLDARRCKLRAGLCRRRGA